MTSMLFRQEAIDAQRTKIWGDVTVSIPLPLTTTTLFLVASLAAIAAFVATGTYSRKEHAPGFLAPTLGIANIVAARPGTIAAVHVREGQSVEKGAPLITVSVEQSSEAGGGVDSASLDSLRQQRRRLDEQIMLDRRRTEAEAQRLADELAGLAGEIDAMEAQRKVLAQRSVIARDEAAVFETLGRKGVASTHDVLARQDGALAAQAAELELVRLLGTRRKDLATRRGDLATLPIAAAQRLSQLQAAIDDAEVRIRQTDGQRAYLVTAPKAGRVSALQAWVGRSVDTRTPQMSIVPEGDVLTAELFVPMRAIGFVAPGQTVHLGYTSFPYQQFGFAEAIIETVSHTLLQPDQAAGPMTFGAPAYRVTARLARQSVAAYGREVPLQADMQLDAEIVLDRRSLFQWLADPLLSSWRRPR